MRETTLTASLEVRSFEEWWEPFTLGVGPAGAYATALDDAGRTRLRERCRELAGPPPLIVRTAAWAAAAVV